MNTYRDLFRAPEFTPFFATAALQVAATTVRGLALAVLVYVGTGSPLLAALSMSGPSVAQVVAAVFLLSAADRLPPRAATAGMALFFALTTAVMAVPGVPLWAVFVLLLANGLVAAVGGGVRYGLLTRILPTEGYLLGRSVLNMATGAFQILGFALGGVLVTTLSPRGALVASAALFVAATLASLGLTRRAPRAAGRPSVAETWRTNARLWSLPARRYLFVALWVPNGLIVGCESLFVPYDVRRASLLFAFAAFGMLIGDTVAGRFLPKRWRERLGAPLRLLLAGPYLIFALHPGFAVASVAVALSAVGYASSLLLQEQLIAVTPEDVHGQALGLHSAGMLAMQGIGAALAGAIAQQTSPAVAMTLLALASVAVTVWLAPGLRDAARAVRPSPPRREPALEPDTHA
ncbi:MFS transporter [Streptacidiphilus sp. EB129]|uniref:MFS transporter n=1 Tax=Streptacidiphilus sp. EB129 TaxID=3156262 RepID=UPI00351596C4